MSEYQYYEFRAIDRALIDREMNALRKISTRWEITAPGLIKSVCKAKKVIRPWTVGDLLAHAGMSFHG